MPSSNAAAGATRRAPLFCLILLALMCLPLQAQTGAYVTDDFEVMFRSGPSVQNKIIRALRSGTTLTVIEADVGNGHSQVQTNEGEIGYVLTRFITNTPPASSQLMLLRQQVEALRADPDGLQARLAQAQEENQILIDENISLTTQLQQATNRIAEVSQLSGSGVALSEENKRLNEQVQQLLLQLDDIRIQNDTLKDTNDQKTRITTAGIMLAGLFLGWILSMAGRRRSTHGNW